MRPMHIEKAKAEHPDLVQSFDLHKYFSCGHFIINRLEGRSMADIVCDREKVIAFNKECDEKGASCLKKVIPTDAQIAELFYSASDEKDTEESGHDEKRPEIENICGYKVNESGYVVFHKRNFSKTADKMSFVRVNKDGTATLRVSPKGNLSDDYYDELEEFCNKFNQKFTGRGQNITFSIVR